MATTAPAPTTHDALVEMARRIDAAVAARDLDAVVDCYALDVVWEDGGFARPIRGREELRRYYAMLFTAFPDIALTQDAVFARAGGGAGDGDAVTTWVLRGTFRAPLGLSGVLTPIAPTGDRVEIHGVAVLTVRDGRAAHVRQRWDVLGFQRQIGGLPAAGSWGDQALARLQALGARRRMRRSG
jgi:steroid delta-isomerase-like uncharacterized protein